LLFQNFKTDSLVDRLLNREFKAITCDY